MLTRLYHKGLCRIATIHTYAPICVHRKGNKVSFMKGSVGIGMVLKCSGSKMALQTVPERSAKERK